MARAAKKKAPVKKKKKAAAKSPAMAEAEALAQAKAKQKEAAEAMKQAEKLAKQAKADEAKAKKKAEADAEKAKKVAEQEKFRAATEKSLEGAAKKINGRLDVLERAEKKTDDHRLALALELAAAKEQCSDAKINFKEWAENHLKEAKVDPKTGEKRPLSYRTVRLLLPIGVAEREKEGSGKVLLEDMRSANREANQRLRDKKQQQGDGETPPPAAGDNSAGRKVTPEKLREWADELETEELESFLAQQASTMGKTFADSEEVEEIPKSAPDKMARAKTAFERLDSKQKIEFVHWTAGEVGMVAEFEDEGTED